MRRAHHSHVCRRKCPMLHMVVKSVASCFFSLVAIGAQLCRECVEFLCIPLPGLQRCERLQVQRTFTFAHQCHPRTEHTRSQCLIEARRSSMKYILIICRTRHVTAGRVSSISLAFGTWCAFDLQCHHFSVPLDKL